MKLLILADDFTGALDTGVQLSKHGVKTTVMTNPDTVPSLEKDCQVLVVNANNRHASPKNAYALTQRLLSAYSDFTHIYIKTDSALRGNLSAIFSAALTATKKPLCFIPAFPDLARTTKGATAYVDGQPLEHSVFKDDPRTPTTQSYIPDILNKTHPIACENISSENYTFFTKISPKPDTVYLFDCETNKQLQDIGDAVAQQDLYGLTAGCAGFASTFVQHLPFEKTSFSPLKQNGPVLFVSGSANAVTLNQLSFARKKNYSMHSLSGTMFSTLHCNTNRLETKAFYKDLSFLKTVETTVKELENKKSVILATATDKEDLIPPENIKKILNFEKELHNYIASYTSSLVKSILDQVFVENIVIFGGDMAAAILETLDCRQVTAAGEITAGVPLCRIDYNNRPRNLATKSGGFGKENLIPAIEDYLRHGMD